MRSIVLVTFAVIAVQAAVDPYFKEKCIDMDTGKYTIPHISTYMKNEYGSKCIDAKLIKITPEIEDLLTDKLNTQRDQFARGLVPRFPKKMRRMAKARYSRTLGYLAQLKIMECKYEHDYCHYTEEHPYSGQSIAIDAQKVPKWVPKEFWKEPIEQAFVQMDDWFLEHEYTPTSYIEKHTTCDALHEGQMLPTSHFTTAVVEDNYEFGCAIMLYKEHYIDANEKEPKNKEKTKYYNHLVCDFAATNLMNQTTAHYSKGGENGKAAEGCTTGPDSYYKGLCSDAENYKDGERHREPTKPFPESPLKGNAPIVIEIPPKFKEILKTIPRGTGEKNPAVKSPVASQPATKTPPKEEPTRSPPVLNKPVASQPVPKTAPKVVPTKPSPQKKNGLFGLCKSGK